MPTFTKDDFADCKITGFEYDYSIRAYMFPIMVTICSSGSIFIKMQMKRKPIFKYTGTVILKTSTC
jgi:hypothetical protein